MCLAWVLFSSMFMALYCTVQLLLYIFNSFYLSQKFGNASLEHVYTNAPHVRLIISAGFKLLRLVIQWCVHNASSISSCCWPLFRCYLSPLCSFMLFPVRQMDRKWDEKLWCEAVWGKMWACAWFSCWLVSADQYWPSVLVQGAELLPAPEELLASCGRC